MTINDVSNVFGFLGGLGMFLYGMNIMAAVVVIVAMPKRR